MKFFFQEKNATGFNMFIIIIITFSEKVSDLDIIGIFRCNYLISSVLNSQLIDLIQKSTNQQEQNWQLFLLTSGLV
jgi:hypothetical protein